MFRGAAVLKHVPEKGMLDSGAAAARRGAAHRASKRQGRNKGEGGVGVEEWERTGGVEVEE